MFPFPCLSSVVRLSHCERTCVVHPEGLTPLEDVVMASACYLAAHHFVAAEVTPSLLQPSVHLDKNTSRRFLQKQSMPQDPPFLANNMAYRLLACRSRPTQISRTCRYVHLKPSTTQRELRARLKRIHDAWRLQHVRPGTRTPEPCHQNLLSRGPWTHRGFRAVFPRVLELSQPEYTTKEVSVNGTLRCVTC